VAIITSTLRMSRGGRSAGELCRRLGVSHETLYRWKRKYGGLEVSDERRLWGSVGQKS